MDFNICGNCFKNRSSKDAKFIGRAEQNGTPYLKFSCGHCGSIFVIQGLSKLRRKILDKQLALHTLDDLKGAMNAGLRDLILLIKEKPKDLDEQITQVSMILRFIKRELKKREGKDGIS